VIFKIPQAESSRYEGRDDFVLEYQPSFLDNVFPTVRLNDGRLTTDYSYMSVDCFHFSQKLHAVGEYSNKTPLMHVIGQKGKLFYKIKKKLVLN
jgi:hypothetical protein